MDLLVWFQNAGLWGLFLGSFLAATIVPFSSEAILAAAAMGPWSNGSLLLAATAGNWLGGLTTYGLGRLGNAERISQWLRLDLSRAIRWESAAQRRGAWLALLTWLPFIGDPLALALGMFKVKPLPVAVLMLIGKAARYAVVIGILRAWFDR
jgi:membrane protein YqaA with SNARE-associated domain